MKNLIFPTRLSTFLHFLSHYSPLHAHNLHSAILDLAVLENISLLPSQKQDQQKEKEIQNWISDQMAEISFYDLSERRKERYCGILLGMVISGMQVGILMGVGVLRSVLEGFEMASEGEDEKGGKDRDRERWELEEWILEGERFVSDLEVLREAIGERYSGLGRRGVEVELSVENLGNGEGEEVLEEHGGVQSIRGEKDEDVPPPIPERSSRRPKPSIEV
jgi:hypothetical protein